MTNPASTTCHQIHTALVACAFLSVMILVCVSITRILFAYLHSGITWLTARRTISRDESLVTAPASKPECILSTSSCKTAKASNSSHNSIHRVWSPPSRFSTRWGLVVATANPLIMQANILESQIPTWTKQKLRKGQAVRHPGLEAVVDSECASEGCKGRAKQKRKGQKPVYRRAWTRVEDCMRLHHEDELHKGLCVV